MIRIALVKIVRTGRAARADVECGARVLLARRVQRVVDPYIDAQRKENASLRFLPSTRQHRVELTVHD